MAKVEFLESSESEQEDQTEEEKVQRERERRKKERIRKKRVDVINKPENKIQEIMTQNELTALELHQTYKTDKKKWVESYRGFPLNISLSNLVSSLIVFPFLLGFLILPLRDFNLWKIIGIALATSIASYYV